MEQITGTDIEKPKELTELEKVLDSTDWVRLKTELEDELLPSGNRGTCDVVGMRIAKTLSDAGMDITPVPVVVPGETGIVSLEHSHVAFLLKLGISKYLIDFTYGFYVPMLYKTKTETNIEKPFVIVPYVGAIPKIGGVEMYRAMSDDMNLILADGVEIEESQDEDFDQEMEMMKASLLKSLIDTYNTDSSISMTFSLDDYLRNYGGIDLKEEQDRIPGDIKQLMVAEYLEMKLYLKESTCNRDIFRERWINDLKSHELNKLVENCHNPK
ncbi:MAG: hypothetical protein UW41_C0019G0010 [Candidatus Collierbacteria bacterium GW2011_GWC2_44_18]|uniref:Uncharacterized protein n=1 Tax=Candidatus Collierbacteria bacterium GW2011_GWC2_44_18 TaxID=1618392 RepID=A0A0G1HPB9_9BACT|nr:MAG: hypothetical protein UW41_C0019G0010 [Candidatus Collierbacteria bacterium GW2011_GWC2_44_18]